MKAIVYGHRFGDQIIPAPLLDEVVEAVKSCTVPVKARASAKIKQTIQDSLTNRGWAGEIILDAASKISITSKKDKVGMCFQTGNMGRMYADLLKLQAVYLRGAIDAAIFILPELACAKTLGENIANSDRLKRELAIFDRVITIPLAIIGIA